MFEKEAGRQKPNIFYSPARLVNMKNHEAEGVLGSLPKCYAKFHFMFVLIFHF